MTTCYEYLRQGKKKDDTFNRLQGYFFHLEKGELNKYHDIQDKRKKKKRNLDDY